MYNDILAGINVTEKISMDFLKEEKRRIDKLCNRARQGDQKAIQKLKDEYKCKIYTFKEKKKYLDTLRYIW